MKPTNEKAIMEVMERWAKAVRDGDMEKIISMHTKDVVMFDVIPPFQINGLKEFRKTWEAFFEHSPGGDGAFDLSDIKIRVNDELAYASARLNVASLDVQLTVGLVKENGEWLIAHEHHSVLEEEE